MTSADFDYQQNDYTPFSFRKLHSNYLHGLSSNYTHTCDLHGEMQQKITRRQGDAGVGIALEKNFGESEVFDNLAPKVVNKLLPRPVLLE